MKKIERSLKIEPIFPLSNEKEKIEQNIIKPTSR
jgi:hypothetical protein